MSKIAEKERLERIVAVRTSQSTWERVNQLKSTTSIDVNETLRLRLDEIVDELEREAPNFPPKRSA